MHTYSFLNLRSACPHLLIHTESSLMDTFELLGLSRNTQTFTQAVILGKVRIISQHHGVAYKYL